MLRFFELFARYTAAIFVAFAVSMGAFLLIATLIALLDSWALPRSLQKGAFFISVAVIGFSGVFAGSLCLKPNSRGQGSITLLILGLIFYAWLQIYIDEWSQGSASPNIRLPEFVSLASGGFCAVVVAFWRWPSKPKLMPRKDGKHAQSDYRPVF